MNPGIHDRDEADDAGRIQPGITVPAGGKLLEWLAVLCVAEIPYRLIRHDGCWTIYVSPDDALKARRLLAEHEAQHHDWPPAPPVAAEMNGRDMISALWAAFWGVYAVAMFYLWLGPYRSSQPLLRAAAGRRQAVRDGEWWRTVTALMIHADVGHLVSNLLFLAVFAALVSRLFGTGLGWLLILAAGAAGNGLTAWTSIRDGVGVGASTACFAALGLLVAHGMVMQLRQSARWRDLWRRAWVPLAGGLAMLSMTGTAPGTDILAHFFGFTAGFALGIPAVPRSGRPPAPRMQHLCLALTVLTVAAAWILAWRFRHA